MIYDIVVLMIVKMYNLCNNLYFNFLKLLVVDIRYLIT